MSVLELTLMQKGLNTLYIHTNTILTIIQICPDGSFFIPKHKTS